MSPWEVTQKPAYANDFVELSKNLQKAVVRAMAELGQDPVTPRGNTIRKMQGWENVWRYRLGDYRLIYAADRDSRWVQLLAVGPRDSIYERFNFRGWDAPGAAIEFGLRMEQAPEWMRHPEWFQPEKLEPQKKPLPRKLTPALLKKWDIPERFHAELTPCLFEQELLNVVDSNVPTDVLNRVIEGLYPTKVEHIAAQPDQVLQEPEDLLAYADGTLTAFLLRLDETQKPLTNWALSGPTLVKGGPGSGKSTVALYRIRAIVEHALETSGQVPSILFTTYTNALTNFSDSLLRQLLRDPLELGRNQPLPEQIRITNIYQLQREILQSNGRWLRPADKSSQFRDLQTARRTLDLDGRDARQQRRIRAVLADLRDEYLLEEFDWVIEGQNCTGEADYLQAERVGRAIPFHQSLRQVVWRLYEIYRRELQLQNRYSYSQIAQEAFQAVSDGDYDRRWDYVIVDEAQDLPPVSVALCVELCRRPTGLFLTADANQSLYNNGFRWTDVHRDLKVQGRTRILRRNYRSTQEIADAAAQIMWATDGFDAEAMEQEFVHSGPYPVVYAAKDEADEASWVARRIYDAVREMRMSPDAAVVLVAKAADGERLARRLNEEGLPAVFMRSRDFNLEDPHVKVTTLHAAKGLEFPIVVIARAEEGHLPWPPTATDPQELAEFMLSQRRMFYVGCTRAMRYLFVTHNRRSPSPFLADLSDDYWMWYDAAEGTLRVPKERPAPKKQAPSKKRPATAEGVGKGAGVKPAEVVVIGTWELGDVTGKAIEALAVGHQVWLADLNTKKKVNRILRRRGYKNEFGSGYTDWTDGESIYRVLHHASGSSEYSRALRREK